MYVSIEKPTVSIHKMRAGTKGWRRRIGCLIYIGLFLQKSPIIQSSFAKRNPQLETSYASSPPCVNLLYDHI